MVRKSIYAPESEGQILQDKPSSGTLQIQEKAASENRPQRYTGTTETEAADSLV